MNDALVVCRFKRFSDLTSDGDDLIEGQIAACHPLCERGPIDELQNKRRHAIRFFETVDAGDVRMVERREHLRFPSEPRDTIGIEGEQRWQYFERDRAIQLRIPRAVHLAHGARADEIDDVVRADAARRSSSDRQTIEEVDVRVV
jgi:hypothetical protein